MPRKKKSSSSKKPDNIFKSIVDCAIDLIQCVNEEGRFVYVNKKWKKTLGYSDKEIKRLKLKDIIRKDYIPYCMKLFKRVCRGSSFSDVKTVFLTRKGGEVFVNGSVSAHFENNNLVKTIGIFRDITKSKETEDELHLQSGIMRNMAEAVYLIKVKDCTIIYANPKFEKMFGYAQGELIGKHVSIVNAFDGKGPRETAKEIIESLKKKSTWAGEIHNVKKDGTPFWCYATVSTFQHHKYGDVWISVHRDITMVKEIERNLKESEERYRKQFEEALDAVFIADAKTGIIIDCNHAACRLLERKKSEIVGRHQRTIHPKSETTNHFSITFRKHLKEKEGQALEAQVITKKGEIKFVSIKANLIDLGGKKLLQGIFRDVTEKKESEKKLLYFQKAVEGSSDAIGMSTPEGKHYYQNEAFNKLFKLSIEEVEGKKGPPSTVYADAKVGQEVFKTIMAGKPWAGEVKMLDRNGQKMDILLRAYAIKDEKGKIIGLIGVHTDITERKKIEEAFKSEKEKAEKYLDVAGTLIVALDPKGKITLLNKKGHEILGYNEGELIGKNWFDACIPKENCAEVKKVHIKNMLGGADMVEHYENPIITKQGEKRIIEWHNAELKDDQGRIIGALSSGIDITQRKKAEKESAMLNKQLEAKVKELESFTKFAVGRELKMQELKKSLSEKKEKLKNK